MAKRSPISANCWAVVQHLSDTRSNLFATHALQKSDTVTLSMSSTCKVWKLATSIFDIFRPKCLYISGTRKTRCL